jgi:hypothetical protein
VPELFARKYARTQLRIFTAWECAVDQDVAVAASSVRAYAGV